MVNSLYLRKFNLNVLIVKNLSLILNGVLAVAVIYLYVLHFSGNEKPSASKASSSAGFEGPIPKIAYVNSDSLLANYDYFKDQQAALEQKAKQLQSEYENRAKGLQGEITAFQRTSGQMTINQAKAAEEDLRNKQQNLMQYQQNLSNQLMQEEGKVNEELYQNVSDYLKELGKSNDFKVVLTYTKGSGVLYADDSLDITRQVVADLNERYKSNDSSTTKADSTVKAKK